MNQKRTLQLLFLSLLIPFVVWGAGTPAPQPQQPSTPAGAERHPIDPQHEDEEEEEEQAADRQQEETPPQPNPGNQGGSPQGGSSPLGTTPGGTPIRVNIDDLQYNPNANQGSPGVQQQNRVIMQGELRVNDNVLVVDDPYGLDLERGDPRDEDLGRKNNCRNLTGPSGKVKTVTLTDGEAEYRTCYGWSETGQMTDLVNAGHYHFRFQNDLLERTTLTENPIFDESEYRYNANSILETLVQSNEYSPAQPVNPGDALPDQRFLQFEYDSVGSLLRQNIQGGNTVRMHYDNDMQRTAVADTRGNIGQFFRYGGLNRLAETQSGRLNEEGNITASDIGPTQYLYDNTGGLRTALLPGNKTLEYEYTALGDLKKVTAPDRSKIVYDEFDASGRARKIIFKDRQDRELYHLEMDFDNMNRLTEKRTVKPQEDRIWKTEVQYLEEGRHTRTIRKADDRIIFESDTVLDDFGRPREVSSPGVGTLTYHYGDDGQVHTLEHSQMGRIARYDYDPLGRVAFASDGLDNITQYQYDSLGHLGKVTPPQGAPTQFFYDINGKPTMTERVYSSEGNTRRDRVLYSYDEGGRLQRITHSRYSGAELPGPEYRYTAASGLFSHAQVRTAQGLISLENIIDRDDSGRALRWRDRRGTLMTRTLDDLGRPELLTAERGDDTHYRYIEYRPDGRLKLVAESINRNPRNFREVRSPGRYHSWNSWWRRYRRMPTYDDRLKSVVYFEYDTVGNITQEKRWIAGQWWTSDTEYVPMASGLRTEITTPSGYAIKRKTDRAGRLKYVKGYISRNRKRGSATYTYQDDSPRLEKIRFDGNVDQHFEYDNIGRIVRSVVEHRDRNLAEMEYRYNKVGQTNSAGQVIFPTEDDDNSVEKGFSSTYDGLGRIRSFSAVSFNQAREVGNNSPVSVETAETVQRYTYNPRGDLISVSTRDESGALTGTPSFFEIKNRNVREWDGALTQFNRRPCWAQADGLLGGCNEGFEETEQAMQPDYDSHVQAHPDWEPSYDNFGRLVRLHNADENKTVRYIYDGLNRLIYRKVEGAQDLGTHYIWDGMHLNEIRKIVGYSRWGNPTYNIYSILHGRGPNDVISVYDRRYVRNHHNRPDGSPVLLTRQSDVEEWYEYSPMGKTRVFEWSGGSPQEEEGAADAETFFLFGGYLRDPLTGFFLEGKTWYDPDLVLRF